MSETLTKESAVVERYTKGACEDTPNLCCPATYPRELLELLPEEIIARDYGCGDPSRYVRSGDTVLDLGSGSGKMCYMAAFVAGSNGAVIGVDMNDEMLALARKYQREMIERLGGTQVSFKKCKIQDLVLDREELAHWLSENPIRGMEDLQRLDSWKAERRKSPAIKDQSIDLVMSNCVLNLVSREERKDLARETFRVLKAGGRIAISDIVCSREVPQYLQDDTSLWSDCVSGASQLTELLGIFKAVGFVDLNLDQWSPQAWKVIDGIEFRSATLTATKPSQAPCLFLGHTVIYRGPYLEVRDDEDHIFPRGAAVSVCERTYNHMMKGSLGKDFIGVPPQEGDHATVNVVPGQLVAACKDNKCC
jgi:arsenite methyltransferase